jgi:hypothetical protein
MACAFLGASNAQETQDVIEIKHADINRIYSTIHELTGNMPVRVTMYGSSLVLHGQKESVAAVEEVIKKLDVAPPAQKNVELTVYMIVASAQAASESLPANLDDVLKQLKAVFPYRGYRLLDNFVLRSRDGQSGDTSGFLPAFFGASASTSEKITYHFHFRRVSLPSGDAAQGIRLDELSLDLKVPVHPTPTQTSFEGASIRTDIDVPEGKKVVVGKTSVVEGSEGALFLVISAKVVD